MSTFIVCLLHVLLFYLYPNIENISVLSTLIYHKSAIRTVHVFYTVGNTVHNMSSSYKLQPPCTLRQTNK